ncbi:hypothetical protein 2210_scaffold709_00068 [Bacteriophage sp.]|nr:hypothetical protein 2210_scaffold709_00068 [Bacteriophage sp.]
MNSGTKKTLPKERLPVPYINRRVDAQVHNDVIPYIFLADSCT